MSDAEMWRCAVCGQHSVTPSLARECERIHASLSKEPAK